MRFPFRERWRSAAMVGIVPKRQKRVTARSLEAYLNARCYSNPGSMNSSL
jgi:hypothetical protein